jgi:fibronectin type 3 domain-containing protein
VQSLQAVKKDDPSSNAQLSALTISSGTLDPAFSSATTSYSASVSNATTSVTVTTTAADSHATIDVRINGGSYAPVASGYTSASLSLDVGDNTIDIRVTAEDFSLNIYTIVLTRLALLPPTNIAVSKDDTVQINITWDAAADADTYYIYRSILPDSGYSEIANVYDTSYSDTTAVVGTIYYYKLYSWNSVSGLSAESTYYDGYRAIDAPTGVDASNGLNDGITITWNSVENADSYSVFRLSSGSYIEIAADIVTTSYTDTSVERGVYYYYRVKTVIGDVTSDFSWSDSGYRFILATPSNIEASDGTSQDHIEISWDPVSGATEYWVYRSFVGSGYYSIGSTTGLSFNDTDPALGDEVYYKVRAYSAESDYSDYSNYDTGYKYFPTPTGLTATEGTYSDRIELEWDEIQGCTMFELSRATSISGPFTVFARVSGLPMWWDDDITIGQTYYYRIRGMTGPYGDYNYSEYSATVSGYTQ